MAIDQIILNNYSDDAQIKSYIANVLMPRVFHDIPINVLNTGQFSIINEYMSQAIENLAFTSSFYLNESFITKSVLADSIYSEAAIFNIGYSFATPSVCGFLLELKIEDLQKNAKYNPDNDLYEFVLDKNTKFNMKNGNVYSLDYDVLIQYQTIETSTINNTTVPAWNVQYTNMEDQNSIAVNSNPFILYRVTESWLCLFVKASEYERQTHTVINNMTNGIPNADKVITCQNHIAGFDIKYTDGDGNSQYLDKNHILPIHSDVKDQSPYIHYIMDDPQTIRFMFQLNGNRYFVPQLNSSFEITIYTCHGEAANFTAFDNDLEQPAVITSSNRFSDNGNVTKAAFVTSGSLGGTNIGTIETTRRETIQAYNTANVISTDHDLEEYFKTFFFKNILYPFFFKRRDDPWGRIWSGFFALKDTDNTLFRTNTLHANIPYNVLYQSKDNLISNNEIIIPPGWAWVYKNTSVDRYTVTPLLSSGSTQVETADTALSVDAPFVFANPFGIRIQKDPFAIGYFNPWVNAFATASIVPSGLTYDNTSDLSDVSILYHATPTVINIKRTYQDDYYVLSVVVSPNADGELDGSAFVKYLRVNTTTPTFSEAMWNYFIRPTDLFSTQIPMLVRQADEQYLVFDPEKTFFCVRNRNQVSANKWVLKDFWIEDNSTADQKVIALPITGISGAYGTDAIWGEDGLWNGYEVKESGSTDINIYPTIASDLPIEFARVASQNYYWLSIKEDAVAESIVKITTGPAYQTSLTKYGETNLWRIGQSYETVYINIYFADGTSQQYHIDNAANVYCPYTPSDVSEDGTTTFILNQVIPGGILLYADMKPTASESAIQYYRIPFSLIQKDVAMFYLTNSQLPVDQNDLRVVLEAKMNGITTGRLEMQPVRTESDGSTVFEAIMYPLNKLVDVDNRIQIASLDHGGGSWIPATSGGVVTVDATNPEFQLSMLFRSTDTTRPSPITDDSSYTGFRKTDTWNINDISLVQELNEMRSVTTFGEYQEPSSDQIEAYNAFISLIQYQSDVNNLYTIKQFAYHVVNGTSDSYDVTFQTIKLAALDMYTQLSELITTYSSYEDMPTLETSAIQTLMTTLQTIQSQQYQSDIDWTDVLDQTTNYGSEIDTIFKETSVNSSVEIQLVPFVQSSLMTSKKFETFVSAFTQVHTAIEPVIFNRLEGNNYLDCKLIATYGLPHSYCADLDQDIEPTIFWPDLSVQIQFDVKLYNPSLETNTLNELRSIVKSYFNRLTTVHTPVDMISMDHNIYISQLIQKLEEHPNVAYLKYRGFYTDEKDIPNGKYMNANYQGIVQVWNTLDEMPMDELERYVPEMFVLDDENIVLNVL